MASWLYVTSDGGAAMIGQTGDLNWMARKRVLMGDVSSTNLHYNVGSSLAL